MPFCLLVCMPVALPDRVLCGPEDHYSFNANKTKLIVYLASNFIFSCEPLVNNKLFFIGLYIITLVSFEFNKEAIFYLVCFTSEFFVVSRLGGNSLLEKSKPAGCFSSRCAVLVFT